MKQAMKLAGQPMSDAMIADMIAAVDTNNDGKINYDGSFAYF